MKKLFILLMFAFSCKAQQYSDLRQITVHLNSAQIQGSYSSPVPVGLPLPGANSFYEVVSASVLYHYGGVPFNPVFPSAANAAILIYSETSTEAQASTSTILTSTGNRFLRFSTFGSDVQQVVMNKDLVIRADANSTLGNGTMDIFISYRVMSAFNVSNVASPIFDTIVTLSSAQILNLFTTPVTLIPSPGTTKTIELVSATAKLLFNTTAYATSNQVALACGTATAPQITFSILNGNVNKKFIAYPTTGSGAAATQLIANQALIATNQVNNPTLGDSPVELHIYYRIVDY